MTSKPVIPRSTIAKAGGNLARRRTPPLTPIEAFRTVRSMWKDPVEGPCKFACGTCLLCRIHERAMKHAQLQKSRKKAAGKT